MIYCMSDIHGRLDLFQKMLDKISLSHNDTLYILGDVINRGGGISVLERIIDLQKAGMVKFIRGNHEECFANAIPLFNSSAVANLKLSILCNKICSENKDSFISKIGNAFSNISYFTNIMNTQTSVKAAMCLSNYGQYKTAYEFFQLSKEKQSELLDFIMNAPLYIDVDVDGKKFRLTHAGCKQNGETDINIRKEFFTQENPLKDTTIIFGHTTTKDIRIVVDGEYTTPTVWSDSSHNGDKICIDCGAAFYGGKLACLRLDDMKEFYVENEQDMSLYVEDINHFAKTNNLPVNPNHVYAPITHKIIEMFWQIEQEEKEEAEKYGEYYIPYISKYPLLPDREKELWVSYLKSIEIYKELLKLSPNNTTYNVHLKDYEYKLKQFYSEHSIVLK